MGRELYAIATICYLKATTIKYKSIRSKFSAHIWAYAQEGRAMTTIEVFDTEARRIERLAEKYDTCDASVIETLFDILEEHEIDIDEAW